MTTAELLKEIDLELVKLAKDFPPFPEWPEDAILARYELIEAGERLRSIEFPPSFDESFETDR